MLSGFAGQIAVWQDLTPSIENVQSALDHAAPFEWNPNQRLETQPRGGTLLYDAVTLVAGNKLKRVTGRKTMVLITDGDDQGSIAGLKKAVQSAQEADTVIYGIRYQDRSFAVGTFDTGMGNLVHLAEPTGGRAFDAMKDTSLEGAFIAISEEMRNQYGLAFTPTEEAGKGEFHKLEIRLRKPGLKAQARAGYYR
jgi:Ca-activated chloride channel family protein